MEFYNVMLGINSLLLLICMGLVGVIWSGIQEDKKNTRDDFKDVWKELSKQNQSIMNTLKLAELNQLSINRNQEVMVGMNRNIEKQAERISELSDKHNEEVVKRNK